MSAQALQQSSKYYHSISWGRIAVGVLGIIALIIGLRAIYLASTSPHRHTEVKSQVNYEPVIDDVLTGKRASTGLYWIPVSLTVPDTISIQDSLTLEMTAPLLTDVELVTEGKGVNATTYVDGPSVQEFIQNNPDINSGITLDGSGTYVVTMLPVEDEESGIEFDGVRQAPQELSAAVPISWKWTMAGMQSGLRSQKSQFAVLVHDQNGKLVGEAIATLTFSNTVMQTDFVFLIILVGTVLTLAGFGPLINSFADGTITRYAREKGFSLSPHQHRFGATAILWALARDRKLKMQNKIRSPFGKATADSESTFELPALLIAMPWLQFPAYMPGTRAFQRRLHYLVIMGSQERTQKFLTLTSLKMDKKQKLGPVVRRLSRNLARIDVYKETFRTIIVLLTYLGVALSYGKVIDILFSIFQLFPWLDELFDSSILIGMLGGVLIGLMSWLIFIPLLFPVLVMDQLLEIWRRVRYPEAIIVENLISILTRTERSDTQWVNKDTKKEVLAHLEMIANSMEYYLPRRLRSRDVNTDQWFEQRASGIATAVRKLKLWVLTPKADTRHQFVSRIAAFLEQFLGSEWDALPYAQSSSPLRATLLITRILNVLWTLFVGVVPFLAVQLAYRYEFMQPGDEITRYVSLGTVLFAILNVILALDPRFTDKIGALKNVLDLLNPLKKSS